MERDKDHALLRPVRRAGLPRYVPRVGRIWVISGTPASGKSTVSRALSFAVPRGVHIQVDDLRWMVGAGFAGPRTGGTEWALQARLARATAGQMALRYAADGAFDVFIDDVLIDHHAGELGPEVTAAARRIVLLPSLEETLRRNRWRQRPFDTSVLEPVIARLHPMFERENTAVNGWERFDTTDLTVEDTVRILLEGN